MLAIIVLNAIFAALVVGGIVALLGRSIWTSRFDAPAPAPAPPERTHARARTARRRLAPVAG